MRKLICLLTLLFIIHAGPTSGTPPAIPDEPEPGVASPAFVDWNLLPNSLVVFNFDLNLDGRVDYVTFRRIKPEGQGWAMTKEDAEAEIPNWPHSLFLYWFDGGAHSYRWLAIERFPLFYSWNNAIYIDSEEDGVNGNEKIYEILGEHKYSGYRKEGSFLFEFKPFACG